MSFEELPLSEISSYEDTIEYLKEYCTFGDNRTYIVVLIARQKENEAINHGQEPVFREILTDTDTIRRRMNRLEAIFQHYTAEEDVPLTFRLYVTANARDVQKSFFEFQKQLSEYNRELMNEGGGIRDRIKRLDSQWKSTLQTAGNKDSNNFVIDCDTKEESQVYELYENLQNVTTIKDIRETPNGFHFLTDPFGFPQYDWIANEQVNTDDLIYLYRETQSEN